MSLLDVGFGWLLGFGSSFIFRWYDRNQKTNEFRNGLTAELQEILPLLAGNVFSLKDALGELDRDCLEWFQSVISNYPEDIIIDVQKELLTIFLNLSPEQLSAIMRLRDALKETGRGKGLKKYYLNFYENNIPSISLFPADYQALTFKIHTKLQLINQEIDRYLFYFDKTFDPNSVEFNQDILRDNMRQCLRTITITAFDAANAIIKLQSMLKAKTRGFLYNITKIFNKIRYVKNTLYG